MPPFFTTIYDEASRLTTLNHDLPGSADDQNFGFTYTPASQVHVQTASSDAYTWQAPSASKSYVRDGRNRYTSISGVSFTHDGRGNVTGDGTRTLGYDLENRLLSVSGPASLTLSYDPGGRLRQIQSGSTTQLLYSGNQLVGEYSGATLLRRYVHGPGVDEPLVWFEGSGFGDARYLIADRQGSVMAVNGASTTRQRYGPYGEPEAWAGSRFRYTGQIALPEASLYHYKARVYDPLLGRFLQTDPVGYADDLNLYAYARNDPLNSSDSTGKCPLCVGFLVGGGLEVLVQAVEIGAGVRSDFSIKEIGVSAVAGATGVGAARLIGRAGSIGTLGKAIANRLVDGTVSAGSQAAKDGDVSLAAVATDVAAGALIGGPVGDRAAASAAKSAEGRVLERQADRAERIAANSARQARQETAAAARTAQEDHVATAAAVAGANAANVGSSAVDIGCAAVGKPDCK